MPILKALKKTSNYIKELYMAWDDEKKAKVIKEYVDEKPTADNSMEIVKSLAENYGETPNGVRMILSKAGVYVKKEAAAKPTSSGKEPASGTTRVSKEASIDALRALIVSMEGPVNEEILTKLTGKAAVYFVDVLKTITEK